MNTHLSYERGGVSVSALTIAGLIVFCVGFAGLAVWAYVSYIDQKDNVDAKVSKAVAVAEKEQADQLEAKFIEREKEPNRSFAGPSDFGSVSFKYPKTWSVYVDNSGTGTETFNAYLNPGTVPSLKDKASRYALRVSITGARYEDVLEQYKDEVEKGSLKSSVTKSGTQTGTRFDGNFTKDIRGSSVVFKIRDKTLTVRTDADTFKEDFEAIIKTITFIE
jgi:hypothetical protein